MVRESKSELQDTDAKARVLRKQIAQNIDPLAAREAERTQRQREKAVTFRLCAEQYIASHKAGWKNAKHAAQWSATLATYADPVIGSLPAQNIDAELKMLEVVWFPTPMI